MAKTQNLPRGTSPPSLKVPRRNKRGDVDNHDDGNKSTPKKPKKDDNKRKEDETANEINAEAPILPDINAGENIETHSENELSLKNNESMGSDIDVFKSTVRNKNYKFHFGKFCLYL